MVSKHQCTRKLLTKSVGSSPANFHGDQLQSFITEQGEINKQSWQSPDEWNGIQPWNSSICPKSDNCPVRLELTSVVSPWWLVSVFTNLSGKNMSKTPDRQECVTQCLIVF